jgi:hypothetical protein
MPIRINLLAEAQALEEERRKDPVKRAFFGAGVVILLVGFWSGFLQMKAFFSQSDLNSLEARWNSIDKQFQAAMDSQRKAMEAQSRLASLHQLATNRFLWGNVLNAFQATIAAVDHIQVTRFRVEQAYSEIPGVPARTNAGVVIRSKPPTAVEKIVFSVEGIDTANPPGSEVSRFKEAIATNGFLRAWLQKTNGVLLTALSAPQVNEASNHQFVTFSLQCSLPERSR